MKRFILFIYILFFASAGRSLAQTHVQTNTLFQVSAATTIASTFAAASTSGNLIVVHVDWDNQARSVTSVTDNKGNSYARISGPTNWHGVDYRAELWYAYNIIGGGGAIKVTAQISGAPTSFTQIYISEYSGILSVGDPLDMNAVAIGNGNPVSSGNKTTTYNIASYNAGFTVASGEWVAQMATFISTSSSIILPVDFASFTGLCKNDQVVLDWSTANELNNDEFTMEKSADRNSWEPVGTVKSKGNASTRQDNHFIPDNMSDDLSYFCIRQTDLDGKSKYSEIIFVRSCCSPKKDIEIYPNPTNGVTLSGKIKSKMTQPWSIVIYDKLGNVITRSSSNQTAFTIYFPHTLTPGIYYAGFSSGNVSKATSFLVRN
ncbi:MAG TPA: T9SS type A sorting domain-containing protein [Puia sp.]